MLLKTGGFQKGGSEHGLDLWFSNICVYDHCLENLLKHRHCWAPPQSFCFSKLGEKPWDLPFNIKEKDHQLRSKAGKRQGKSQKKNAKALKRHETISNLLIIKEMQIKIEIQFLTQQTSKNPTFWQHILLVRVWQYRHSQTMLVEIWKGSDF